MGTVVACVNSRRGVGKTTLAVHLAAWCHEHGSRIGLVEADARGTASGWLRQAEPDVQRFRLPTPDEILDRVPDLAVQFDVLVLDGVTGSLEITRALLLVAHLALIPFGTSAADQLAVAEAVCQVQQARRIRSGPPQALLVPNLLRGRGRLYCAGRDRRESFRVPLLDGLGHRGAYAEAADQQTLVWRLGPHAEEAAAEMTDLFERLGIPGPVSELTSAVQSSPKPRRRGGRG